MLTVTADNQNKGYGATNPVLTASYSGFVNGDTAAVLSGELSLTTEATESSPVGAYPITAAVGTLSATNYALGFVEGTLTIDPGLLTVAADKQSRGYGATNPVLTATYSGFVNGETPSALGGTLAFVRAPGENVGNYTITPSGLTSGNYAIAFNTGTLSMPSPGTSRARS